MLFNNGPLTVAEPMAVLLKEALTQIGLRLELIKVPGTNFQAEPDKMTVPIVTDRLATWPDYNLFFDFPWHCFGVQYTHRTSTRPRTSRSVRPGPYPIRLWC